MKQERGRGHEPMQMGLDRDFCAGRCDDSVRYGADSLEYPGILCQFSDHVFLQKHDCGRI